MRGQPRARATAADQPQHDRHVDGVPGRPVDERRTVGAGGVEDHPREPAAQRHGGERRHQYRTDPRPGLLGREVLAHDDRVGRHDAALEQTEQGRDHVDRGQVVERGIERECRRLQQRTGQQRREAADSVGDEARPS